MRAGTISTLLDEADGGAGRRFLVFPDIPVASRVAHVLGAPFVVSHNPVNQDASALNSQAKISLVGLEKVFNLLCVFRCLI